MKSYSDKLKSPKWQKKRLEILNLRGFKCELCGCEEKELHVHHRFYLKGREVWQYDNDVFQVLCCDCHKKEHKHELIDTKYDEILETLKSFNTIDLCTIHSLISRFNTDIELLDLLNNAIYDLDYVYKLKNDLLYYDKIKSDYFEMCQRLDAIEKYLQTK